MVHRVICDRAIGVRVEHDCGQSNRSSAVDFNLRMSNKRRMSRTDTNGRQRSQISLLIGKLTALSGSITHAVNDVTAQKAFLQRKSGIGYMPQTRMVFDDPTARENLSLGDNQSTNDLYFDRLPCLEEHLAQVAGTMSGGKRKISAFVRAMIEDTKLIILDEPSRGI